MRLGLCLAFALLAEAFAAPHVLLSAGPIGHTIGIRGAGPRCARAHCRTARTAMVVEQPGSGVAAGNLTRSAAARYVLVRKGDTWHAAQTLSPELRGGELSDAIIASRTDVSGQQEWQVRSPITFSYRVKETADVLDPSSDLLLYGHVTDPLDLEAARARPLKRVVVVDANVDALYGKRIRAYFAAHRVDTKLLVVQTCEETKGMDLALRIAAAIDEHELDRRLDPVIAIGGGVCMDVVGFAASMYRRRTPYVRVPTTLMGYVDASVGAKSGVNFCGKKNRLGSYLPPALSILDASFFATLPRRHLSNGAAEVLKMALVKDAELFDLLHEHGHELLAQRFLADSARTDTTSARVLRLAIARMLEELAPNLWEDSLRRLVDFGHVFSCELEMCALEAGGESKLLHGEAVAVDMAFSTVLACTRGHIDEPTRDLILRTLRRLELPTYHPMHDAELCDRALAARRSFSQGLKIPLPVGIGAARIFDDVTTEQIGEALRQWEALCRASAP